MEMLIVKILLLAVFSACVGFCACALFVINSVNKNDKQETKKEKEDIKKTIEYLYERGL